jgi:hypothetical protein
VNEQWDPYRNQALIVEYRQALEAAQSALVGDISAFRQAVLKGSQLLPRDCENLLAHLRQTKVLLAAAAQACQEMILSFAQPIQFERRRVSRHAFGGVAEMSTGHSNSNIIGLTAAIGRFGCFVRTCASVPVGTKISLKINYRGSEFKAPGEVVYARSEEGVGIKFAEVAAKDAALLEAWLRQTAI